MIVVFRTDASLQIGSGHVMRCLTLACALRERGAAVRFLCRVSAGDLISTIEDCGFAVTGLPAAQGEYQPAADDLTHASWLGVPWAKDASDTVSALGEIRADWLVVDHYAIDRRWEERLRPYVAGIAAIDDLADRPHDCDLLLDQNLYQDMETRYADLVPGSCRRLLGPKYALLRPEFAAARKSPRRRDGAVRRVFVFFGGVDPTRETEKVLQALAGMHDRRLEVDVVVGGGNSQKGEIERFCQAHGFHYHCQVGNIAELMAAADLAIGAGGTATWERCALGVPALVLSVAKNQQELAETGARRGLFFYLGVSDSVSTNCIQDSLRLFITFPENLLPYSSNGLAAVDAKGAARVANFLVPLPITVRRAVLDDCDSVYAWRNAEETRRYIFDSAPISLETHQRWFRATLENPDRILLIGEMGHSPVGVLRYDVTGDEALISVYLVPGGQGAGVGSQLIRCGSRWLVEHRPEIRTVNAEIFKENVASVRAFESAGYKEHHAIYKEVL